MAVSSPSAALRQALMTAVVTGNEPEMDRLLAAGARFERGRWDPSMDLSTLLLHTVLGGHRAMVTRLMALPEVQFIEHMAYFQVTPCQA
jgi:hypothetical protein